MDFEKSRLVPYGEGYILDSSREVLEHTVVSKSEVIVVAHSDVYKFGESGVFVKISVDKPSISDKNKEMYIVLSGSEFISGSGREKECVVCSNRSNVGCAVSVKIDYIVDVESVDGFMCKSCYTEVIDWKEEVLSRDNIAEFIATIV